MMMLSNLFLTLLQVQQGLLFQENKLYTVFAVLLIIFTGLGIWLIRMDKKLSKLEKQIQNKK
jgi:CcmD family protein